jgi:hypothetical protein
MRSVSVIFAAAACAFAAMPASAQQAGEAEIDALLDASATPEGAVALAQSQEAEGDLTGAAATLERALLASPKANDLRQRYVALLCRLDDRQRARIELASARGEPSSEVQAACGAITAADLPKPSRGWRGQLSAGLTYDRDASGALALQFDIPGLVYPRKDGLAFIAAASIAGRTDIGGNLFFYGAASAQTRNDISGPSYDYQIGSANAGLGVRTGQVEASAGGVLRHAIVSGDRFLTEAGGEAQLALAVADHTRLALRGEIVRQNYRNVPLFSRDGTRYDLGLSLTGGTAQTLSYSVGAAWERKTADTNYLAYHGWRLAAGVRAPVAGNVYGTLGGSVRHIDYYDDPLTRDYQETRWYGRAGIGVPLTERLSIEGAATYTRRDYNAASNLRDYRSVGGELRLIYTFGK